MTFWHELLKNPESIRTLYDVVPDLVDVEIREIYLGPLASDMTMSVVLPRFPEHPPKRWSATDNTAVAKVEFSELLELEIKGWSFTNPAVAFKIQKVDSDSISISALGPTIEAKVICKWFRLIGVDAYRRAH